MSITDHLFTSSGNGRMRAVRITQDHRIDVIETTTPRFGPSDIVVKPRACGICGTDLHILHHGFPGTNYPVTPGHEFAGHVVAIGREVKGVREGDFVAVNPNVVCGRCRWCQAGRPNLCENLSPIGVGHAGAAAEFVAAPAGNAYVVHESLGAPLAALIEPLACVLHAIDSSQGVEGRRVLVLGGGTMGLLIAIVCKRMGAAEVTLADPAPAKHVIAQRAGIAKTVTPDTIPESDFFDVVFEAAGVPRALATALARVEKTGTLVQVGVHDADATFPVNPFRIYEREIKLIGSNSLADKFGAAVDVMSDIRDAAATLIAEPFSVWDFKAAVESMATGHTVKTQLSFD